MNHMPIKPPVSPLHNGGPVFDRRDSTLGIMDDLQVAVHTYDGCSRGCSGCVVDKHFKNRARGEPIMPGKDLAIVSDRVKEYYGWAVENLNTREDEDAYFSTTGHQIAHHSYTMRFGNHSELDIDHLEMIAKTLDSEYRVWSTAPTEEVSKFAELQKRVPGRYFLEIIYDPVADDAEFVRDMIVEMRSHGILGYPEVLITQRLLNYLTPERFVDEYLAPLGDLDVQVQFGRYSPSKTRSYSTTQVVPVDQEVEFLARVAKRVVDQRLRLHPIPIAEYAVTLLDEYDELSAWEDGKGVDLTRLPEAQPFNRKRIMEKTRDIFLSSLYIDHNLDVFVWSESMGQHVLDWNFGFKALGNVRDRSIADIVTEKGGVVDQMLVQVMRELMTHKKCGPCRYKSFCASHAVPLFRQWMDDDGDHCYGYLPVIREFQKDYAFLQNMIDGFRDLEF
ncbi:MAG: hypothetical protein KI792_08545 [Alphaproteobacteria bacterium]|nr:hypothetical protein [Alphaproteobacteria bacterium SS10]